MDHQQNHGEVVRIVSAQLLAQLQSAGYQVSYIIPSFSAFLKINFLVFNFILLLNLFTLNTHFLCLDSILKRTGSCYTKKQYLRLHPVNNII